MGRPAQHARLYRRSLSPEGRCVIVAGTFFLRFVRGPWMTLTGKNKIGTYMAVTKTEDLVLLKQLLEAGEIIPVIDRYFPLGGIPDAFRYLEAGHARGKIVITIENDRKTKPRPLVQPERMKAPLPG